MNLKKMLCLLVVILAVLILIVSKTPVRAEEETQEEETRTSAFYPYYDPYGFYGIPSVNPYSWQYSPYSLYGGLNPLGYGANPFGAQNIYYPMNLPGTNFVFQFPYMQIAPYLGATTFWQNQFPNADWSNVLAGQFLGLINLPGLPNLF